MDDKAESKYPREKYFYIQNTNSDSSPSSSSSSSVASVSSGKIYDLPLNRHADATKGERVKEAKSKTSSVAVVSKFRSLIMPKVLSNKISFDFFRNVSIEMLRSDVRKKLTILTDLQSCSDNTDPDKIPYKTFSWDYDDFLERRKITKLVWIDILFREIGQDCLDSMKFKLDLQELMKYLDMVMKAFLHGETDGDPKKDVVATINSVYGYVHIFDTLSEECQNNTTQFRVDINRSLGLRFQFGDPKTARRKHSLEEKILNTDVWDPIELRYQLHYYKSEVAQNSDKLDKELGIKEKEIKNYERLIVNENFCSQCALNSYFADIGSYKSQIEKLTMQFAAEEEKYDNKQAANRILLEKLQSQKKYLMEEIDRFHKEREQLNEREILNKLREERLHQEKLQHEADKLAAKAAKIKEKKLAKLAAKKAMRQSISDRTNKKK